MLYSKYLYVTGAITGILVGWLSTNFVYGLFTQYNGSLPMPPLLSLAWNSGFKFSAIITLIGALIGLMVAFTIHMILKLKLPKN